MTGSFIGNVRHAPSRLRAADSAYVRPPSFHSAVNKMYRKHRTNVCEHSEATFYESSMPRSERAHDDFHKVLTTYMACSLHVRRHSTVERLFYVKTASGFLSRINLSSVAHDRKRKHATGVSCHVSSVLALCRGGQSFCCLTIRQNASTSPAAHADNRLLTLTFSSFQTTLKSRKPI